VTAGVSFLSALIPFIALTVAARVAGWISLATYRVYMPVTFLTMLCIPASVVMAVWKENLDALRAIVIAFMCRRLMYVHDTIPHSPGHARHAAPQDRVA
jgi:hypothetical protein